MREKKEDGERERKKRRKIMSRKGGWKGRWWVERGMERKMMSRKGDGKEDNESWKRKGRLWERKGEREFFGVFFGLVVFYGISTIRGWCAKSPLYIYIEYMISKHILLITFLKNPELNFFFCSQFNFKQFSLAWEQSLFT